MKDTAIGGEQNNREKREKDIYILMYLYITSQSINNTQYSTLQHWLM